MRRHAGKSRVKQVGIEGTALGYHVWKRGAALPPLPVEGDSYTLYPILYESLYQMMC